MGDEEEEDAEDANDDVDGVEDCLGKVLTPAKPLCLRCLAMRNK